MTARKPLWLMSSRATNWPPALLTSTSSEPCAAITVDELLRRLRLADVADRGRHSPPGARIAAAVSSSSSSAPRHRDARAEPAQQLGRRPADAGAAARTSAERPARLPSRRTLSTRTYD